MSDDFENKSRREQYIVRDDVVGVAGVEPTAVLRRRRRDGRMRP